MPPPKTFGKKDAFGTQTAVTPPLKRTIGRTGSGATPLPLPRLRWPVFTLVLTALLTAIFWLEMGHRVDPIPGLAISLRDSVALGGLSRYLAIRDHEWWRIFSAPFLHGSLAHLVGNAVALVLAGYHLERMLGRNWVAALFFAGAAGGSLGSLAYGSENVVSVGASGAIMCLVTALFVLSHHFKAGNAAPRLRRRALGIVVPALLPTAADSVTRIDYGAHFGGALAGLALGFLLLIVWPEENPLPPWRNLAACVCAFGIGLAVFAAFQVELHYSVYAARSASLIPTARESSDPQSLARESPELVGRFPNDPLARLLRGTDLFDRRDFNGAEEQARIGLSEREVLATEFAPVLERQLNLLLMASLWGEGRVDDARALAPQVCGETSSDAYLASGQQLLRQSGACR